MDALAQEADRLVALGATVSGGSARRRDGVGLHHPAGPRGQRALPRLSSGVLHSRSSCHFTLGGNPHERSTSCRRCGHRAFLPWRPRRWSRRPPRPSSRPWPPRRPGHAQGECGEWTPDNRLVLTGKVRNRPQGTRWLFSACWNDRCGRPWRGPGWTRRVPCATSTGPTAAVSASTVWSCPSWELVRGPSASPSGYVWRWIDLASVFTPGTVARPSRTRPMCASAVTVPTDSPAILGDSAVETGFMTWNTQGKCTAVEATIRPRTSGWDRSRRLHRRRRGRPGGRRRGKQRKWHHRQAGHHRRPDDRLRVAKGRERRLTRSPCTTPTCTARSDRP